MYKTILILIVLTLTLLGCEDHTSNPLANTTWTVSALSGIVHFDDDFIEG